MAKANHREIKRCPPAYSLPNPDMPEPKGVSLTEACIGIKHNKRFVAVFD